MTGPREVHEPALPERWTGAEPSKGVPKWQQPLKRGTPYTTFIRILTAIWLIIVAGFVIRWFVVPSSSAEVAATEPIAASAPPDGTYLDYDLPPQTTYDDPESSEITDFDANNSAPIDAETSLETIDDEELDDDYDENQEDNQQVEQLDSTYARPSINGKRKAIVTSTWGAKDITAWIPKLLPDWDMHSYVTDHIGQNKNTTLRKMIGREAAVYLTYIVDNYDDLPDYIVFYHGPRYQWHNDEPMLDGYPTIANLSLEHIDDEGYVSLRCDRHVGCDTKPIRPQAGHKDAFFEWRGLYAKIFKNFFPGVPIPEKVQTQCCGQFAVSKAAVQATPHEEWKRRRQWLWSAKLGSGSFKVGTSFEYLWHIIFGKPPIHCPTDMKGCYCKKWGACGLECRPWMCKGRWWNNALKKLPTTWPAKEAQGKNGWPIEGWWNYLDKNWGYHPPKNPKNGKPPIDGRRN